MPTCAAFLPLSNGASINASVPATYVSASIVPTSGGDNLSYITAQSLGDSFPVSPNYSYLEVLLTILLQEYIPAV